MSKYGYYQPWYLAGGCIALIGSALMYADVSYDTSPAKIYGFTVLLGIGGGMYAQASFAVAQVKVAPHDIPMAIGWVSLAQIGGATIALAIANSVFLNRATEAIAAIVPSASRATILGALSGGGNSFFQTLTGSVRVAVFEALTTAIGRIYILSMTGAALSIVLACFMPFEKVGRALFYASTMSC